MAIHCCELVNNAAKQRRPARLIHTLALTIGYTQLVMYCITSMKFAHGVFQSDWYSDEFDVNSLMDIDDRTTSPKFINEWLQWIFLLFSIIGFLSVLYMIYGIKRKKPDLMMPWFIFHSLYIYFNILSRMIFYVIRSSHPWLYGIFIALENSFYSCLLFIVYLQFQALTLDRVVRSQETRGADLSDV